MRMRSRGYSQNVEHLSILAFVCGLSLVSGQINQIPWSCGFSDDWCGFSQIRPSHNYDWLRFMGSTPSRNTGPDGDHTGVVDDIASNKRYYMYVEATPAVNGVQSRLRSPNIIQTGQENCLSFYMSVYGMHIGKLQVEVGLSSGGREIKYTYTGDWTENDQIKYRTAWLKEEVTLPSNTIYFDFLATRGGTAKGEPYGDIGIDDLQIVPGPCTSSSAREIGKIQEEVVVCLEWPGEQTDLLPDYSLPSSENCPIVKDIQECSFDVNPPALTDKCQFVNDPLDDLAWYHQSGPTPTPLTGPSQDATRGDASGYFLYMKAAGETPGHVARLYSPDLVSHGGPFCLMFKYHMFGQNVGFLKVFQHYAVGDPLEIWSQSGNQGNVWGTTQPIDVQEGVVRISIEATRGGSIYDPTGTQEGDIAIDGVILRYPSCSNIQNCENPSPPSNANEAPVGSSGTGVFNCNLELGTCAFSNDETSTFLWFRNKGATPTVDTGPKLDHTLGPSNPNGNYMYTEASKIPGGEKARLISPAFSGSGQYCVSAWYFAYGQHIGMFSVNVLTTSGMEETIWSRNFIGSSETKTDASGWQQLILTLPMQTARLVFVHERGMDQGVDQPHADLAIDDIAVTAGACQQQTTPTSGSAALPSGGSTGPAPSTWVGENNNNNPSPTPTPGGVLDINTGFQECETQGSVLAQCNFEQDLCGFGNSGSFGQSWTRSTGYVGPPGPSFDRTKGQYGDITGYYLSFAGFANSNAVFESPTLNQPYSVQFWYFSEGQHDGSLAVVVSPSGAQIFFQRGMQAIGWQLVTVTLPPDVLTVGFEATAPTQGQTVFAIDEIIIRQNCQEGDNLGGWSNQALTKPEAIDVNICLDPGLCPEGTKCYTTGPTYFCVPAGKCKKKK